jgi:hypothetical protein
MSARARPWRCAPPSLEREFGRIKNEWGGLPLRVRRLPRVRLHVDLTILAQLADAVTRADAVRAA